MGKTKEKIERRHDAIENAAADAQAMAMANPNGGQIAIDREEAARAFLEEVKGPREEPSQVPIVSIDHGGASFVLPSGEHVPEISGYPLYYFQTRRWYQKPPVVGVSAPPDCWSADMVKPHISSLHKQSEVCATCPLDQFGTGRDGKSKACGARTWVFLMNPDFGTPPLAVVICPPSSIRSLLGTRFKGGYFSMARAKYRVYEIVWTTFTLSRQGEQVKYCVVEPRMGPACTDLAKIKELAAFRNTWAPICDKLRGLTPQATTDSEE